jgi:hypothetical protein
MKKLSLAIVGLVAAVNANSADSGVGASIGTGDDTIYIPINLSESFRIEPYVSAYKVNDADYSYRRSRLGVGLFKLEKTSSQTSMYWGARASYIDGRDSDDGEFDGYSIAPVLGFEYFPVKNFSVGGDVALEYIDIDSDSGDYPFATQSSSTKTSVGVKFYF